MTATMFQVTCHLPSKFGRLILNNATTLGGAYGTRFATREDALAVAAALTERANRSYGGGYVFEIEVAS